MWSPETLLIVGATFVFAGLVKGVVGLGLPAISLAILTATIGLIEAMAIMLIPALATNVWQALAGPGTLVLLRRLWPFLTASVAGTWMAVGILAKSDTILLSGLLGLLLAMYSMYGLVAPRIPSPGRHEIWAGPVIGIFAGGAAGLTGSFIMPGGIFLQALGLPPAMMIKALGISFTLAAVTLGLALKDRSLLPTDLLGLSMLAVVPSFAGMFIGQKIRMRLDPARFRRVFFAALLVFGIYLIAKAYLTF